MTSPEPPPRSDARLVTLAAAGDREAFAAIYHRYHQSVYRFARMMTGSAGVAEDVTQEVFMALMRDLARYEPLRARLSTYFHSKGCTMPRMNPIAGPRVPPHVNGLLGALADADRRVTVPSAVDAAVMRAWDAAHATEPSRIAALTPSRVWSRTVWPIAGAAAAVLLAVAARMLGPGSRPIETSRVQPDVVTVQVAPEIPPQVSSPAAPPPVPTNAHRASRRAHQPGRLTTPQDDVGLVLVADPMFDSTAATVIRVRMPRSALAALGLPIAEPDAAGAVDVEMLVGEDGVARTIRRATSAPANPDQE